MYFRRSRSSVRRDRMPGRQRVGRVLAHCVGVAGNILVVKLVFIVGDVQPGALPLHRSEIGYSGLHSRKYSPEAPQARRRLFPQPRWSNSNKSFPPEKPPQKFLTIESQPFAAPDSIVRSLHAPEFSCYRVFEQSPFAWEVAYPFPCTHPFHATHVPSGSSTKLRCHSRRSKSPRGSGLLVSMSVCVVCRLRTKYASDVR